MFHVTQVKEIVSYVFTYDIAIGLFPTLAKLTSTGGSVVEFSPATREARVRFPASANFFLQIG